MQLTLTTKLFLASLTLALLAVALVSGIVWWSIGRGFSGYIAEREIVRLTPLVEALSERYAEDGSWVALTEAKGSWRKALKLRPARERYAEKDLNEPNRGEHGEKRDRGPVPLPLLRRASLLDSDGKLLLGRSPSGDTAYRPIELNGRLIGTLALTPPSRLTEGIETRFLERQGRNLLISGLGAVALAGIIAYLLSRHLLRPIRAMAATTQRLQEGDYTARLADEAARHDELCALARDVNELAGGLERGEASRQRWLQDAAHELRTPLALLQAEIEALQDGIRPLDAEALARLHRETLQLSRLIDDLGDLARAEGGTLATDRRVMPLWPLVGEVAESYRENLTKAGIALVTLPPKEEQAASIDPARMRQVVQNLLTNCQRYTAKGGSVFVSQTLGSSGGLRLTVEDSGPGVPDSALPQLFERFYRIEASRNRGLGGRGLGLSICRSIVRAHGGRIAARHSDKGGLAIDIWLPESDEKGERA